MNYLLDTHILLWWLADDNKLTQKAKLLISKHNNTFFVSSATAWEIGIKKALGKLQSPNNLEEAVEKNNFLPLSINLSHGLAVAKLPKHHQDPFDRMLISQAKLEDLTILTHDKKFKKYKVRVQLV